MSRTFASLLLLLLASATTLTAPPVQRAVFTPAATEHKWALKDLAPELPADWSGYDYLTLEVKASSSQRFQLRLYTTDGTRRLNFNPFQGAWCRVSVPLEYFQHAGTGHDLASASNRSHPSAFLNHAGGYGPIRAVQALGVVMGQPIGEPTLEIRNPHLIKGQPENAVLEPKPLVDEFGQWIPAHWPGKAASLEALKKAWDEEEKTLGSGEFNTCQYGGFLAAKAKATGFFRVEQVDGKWWLVDPDGHLFFSVGADCMRPVSDTRTEGRDGVFAALPPAELLKMTASRTRRASQRQGRPASFHTWNLARRFGPEWEPQWIDLAVRRMEAWGLNTIANWSDPRLWDAHRKPYVVNLSWGNEEGPMGLPDVFSAAFARQADAAAAEQCAPRKGDPYLLGYFIANEPPWPGREVEVTNMIQAGPATDIQRELKAWLAQGGDTPARRKAFIYRAFEKYLEVTCNAVRRHDPNHLNLGLRFGNRAPDEMLRACRVFDVFSLNNYSYGVDRKNLDHIYELTGRPMIIGEFHFGTPGRGLDSGLKQTANQTERGVAYQYYIEQVAAVPALVGAHWFQWGDQPATGRFDGENYNIGVVDVTDRPYPELVEAMKATHKRLLAVHGGKAPPATRQARQQ